MAKNAFIRYLAISSAIIIVSFIIFGMLLMSFLSNYWKSEKQAMLSDDTHTTAEMVAALVNRDGIARSSTIKPFVKSFSQRMGAEIFITNTNGVILLKSDENSSIYKMPHVPDYIINEAKDNEYKELGKLGGVYEKNFYTYAVPIFIEDGSFLGVVFASVSTESLKDFTGAAFNMFLLSALLVLIFSVSAVSVMTYNMVRPLRDMAAAAQSFGKGDFSYRVRVNGADEVAQLAKAFNNMAVSLSKLENMRSSFISNVSHELKTPMTTVISYIDGLLDGTIEKKDQKFYLSIVSDEMKRLSRLVKSMLDLSRIDSGKMVVSRSEFDLMELLAHTLILFEHRINEKNITVMDIDNSKEIMMYADPDLMHQVLYNLIDNAVKFTNEGGYIEIKASSEPNGTRVFIRNSGQGIEDSELSNIFERFYKTDKSRSRDRDGVGLGLFIVKNIIDLHSGEIIVRSLKGEYCEFEIFIPFYQQ